MELNQEDNKHKNSTRDPKLNDSLNLGDPKNNVSPNFSESQKDDLLSSGDNQESPIHSEENEYVLVDSDFGSKVIEVKTPDVINHNPFEKSYLYKHTEEWNNFTESLQNKFGCQIFNEPDFSVTYVNGASSNFQQINTVISEFFNESPSDIKIFPHLKDFVKHNKKFSHLKLDKTDQDEICIRNITKDCLSELEKEMRKVGFESCLVDENQYELLHETKKEILTNIEMKFHVKGNLYHLLNVAESPVVFEVIPQTRIFCVVESDLKDIPLDSLIRIRKPKYKSTSVKDYDYEIFQTSPWNIPTNPVVYANVFTSFSEERRNVLFEDCFKKMSTNSEFTVVGLQPDFLLNTLNWKKFFVDFISFVKNFREQIKNKHFNIVLIAEEDVINEMKRNIKKSSPEKWLKNTQRKSLKWICFVNYSDEPENLKLGLDEFSRKTNNLPFTINSKDLEELMFFKDVFSLIPDIIEQYPEKNGEVEIFVPKENISKLKSLQKEMKSKLISNEFTLKKKLNKKQLEILIQKIQQSYPRVTFGVSDDDQNITFKSLDSEINQNIKHDLEYYLGLRRSNSASSSSHFEQERNENHFEDHNSKLILYNFTLKKKINDKEVENLLEKIQQDFPNVKFGVSDDGRNITFKSQDWDTDEKIKFQLDIHLGFQKKTLISEDRFNRSNQETFESDKSNIAASSPQKYKDICCFQVENDLLVKVYQGNILNLDVEGIVNAANKCLNHGGGVAKIIIQAAGDVVNKEGKNKIKDTELMDGDVVSTSAGNLKQYKYIIHAVGPRYNGKDSSNDYYCKIKIAEAVCNSLREANMLGLSSIALPAISSAIFGVPFNLCVEGYFMGVDNFSKEKKSNRTLKEIHFVDIKPISCKKIKEHFAKKLKEVPMKNSK